MEENLRRLPWRWKCLCVRGWGRLSFDFEPNSGKNPADSLSTAGIKTGSMESTNGAGSSSLGLEQIF